MLGALLHEHSRLSRTEFASFEEKPFNPVDSAALSQFCMVRAEGIVPPLRERKAFGRLGTIVKNLLSPSGRPAHFLDTLRAEHYEHMFSGSSLAA